MGSYLQHLVSRTLQPAPAVQPLVASRFEPGLEAAVADPVEVAAPPRAPAGEVAPAETVTVSHREDQRLDAVVALAPQAIPPIAPPARDAPPPLIPESHRDTREPGQPAPLRTDPQTNVETPAAPAAPRPPARLPPASIEARVVPAPPEFIRREVVVTKLEPAAPADRQERDAAPATAAEPRRTEARPTPILLAQLNEAPRAPQVPERAPARSSVISPLLRASPAAFAARAESQSAARAPDVHITIGSVEIRAHTTAARPHPAPKAKAQSQRLSLTLADYLQRRRGERVMSNHLAVATVSAGLGRRAHAAAAGALDADVDLLFGRPTAPSGDNAKPTLHVYLYQVTPNAALRNGDLPSRDSSGRLVARPRASIDLHYLITFYGDAATLVPERMMAAVVRDLHASAVLEPGFIEVVAGGADHPELQDTNLADARERVKFTPSQLTLEELSRLWSIMVQSPYALSIAYLASVVEIDALEGGTSALPVLKRGEDDRGVTTTLGPFPQLDSWWAGAVAAATRNPRLPSFPAAQLGDRLVLAGSTLGGDTLSLRFAHSRLATPTSIVVPFADRSAVELRVTLPNDAAAQDGWAAGVYAVTVEADSGGEVRQSNVMPLVVAPRITDIDPNPAARVAGDVTLTITCGPKVLPSQTVTLLLGDREITANDIGAATDTLVFEVVDAPALTDQIIRIRVDGVPSLPFLYDEPTGGFIFDPQQRVTIT